MSDKPDLLKMFESMESTKDMLKLLNIAGDVFQIMGEYDLTDREAIHVLLFCLKHAADTIENHMPEMSGHVEQRFCDLFFKDEVKH